MTSFRVNEISCVLETFVSIALYIKEALLTDKPALAGELMEISAGKQGAKVVRMVSISLPQLLVAEITTVFKPLTKFSEALIVLLLNLNGCEIPLSMQESCCSVLIF